MAGKIDPTPLPHHLQSFIHNFLDATICWKSWEHSKLFYNNLATSVPKPDQTAWSPNICNNNSQICNIIGQCWTNCMVSLTYITICHVHGSEYFAAPCDRNYHYSIWWTLDTVTIIIFCPMDVQEAWWRNKMVVIVCFYILIPMFQQRWKMLLCFLLVTLNLKLKLAPWSRHNNLVCQSIWWNLYLYHTILHKIW